MNIDSEKIGAKLRERFPQARIDVEHYIRAHWINIWTESRILTVEITDGNREIGFSDITREDAAFGGHDQAFFADSSDHAATVIAGLVTQALKDNLAIMNSPAEASVA